MPPMPSPLNRWFPTKVSANEMARDGVVLPPPGPGGVESARPRDAWRLTWWTLRGWAEALGSNSVPPLARARLVILTLTGFMCYPLAVLIKASLILSSRRATYLTTARDVTAAVVAKKNRQWQLEDHSRAQGARGQDLRDLVFPVLTQAADRDHVTITMTAASSRLAEIYCAEMLGLEAIGRAFPFGVKLQRLPSPPHPEDVANPPAN